jgi:hypothetical protein
MSSRAVDHEPHHVKLKGLSPAAVAGTRRGEMAQKLTRFRKKWSIVPNSLAYCAMPKVTVVKMFIISTLIIMIERMMRKRRWRRHDIQDNDIQHIGTQHND